MVDVCIYIFLGIGALAILLASLRSGHFFRSILSSALQGLASLLAVNVAGALTGVTVAVNVYTMVFCGVLGLPGTIALVLADCLLR